MIIFVIAAMLGSVGRYFADFYLPRHGILVVNVIGSGLAGVLLSLTLLFQLDDSIVQAITGGFAGSLTTFSTVAVAAAEEHLNAAGGAVRLWVLQCGLSITACLTGMVLTAVFLH